MRTLEEVVNEIVKILENLEIDYVIVGGIAVSGWGNIRTTRDVDIIINLEGKDIKRLVEALKERDFSVTVEDIKDALKEKTHFTIFDLKSEYHIDAKGVYGIREKRSLETKKPIVLEGTKIYIASPEDTIANKLLFGSEQDIRDAMSIYVRQMGKLDMDYLEEVCKEMGVLDELQKLRRRVEEALKEGDH
ncbi:DUF6036 family nucleotidyltransferase [Candidatus Pyrohabitans sp.]